MKKDKKPKEYKKATKKENFLSEEEKDKMLLISKIDNLYISIKEETKYFTLVRFIMFASCCVSFAMLWFPFQHTSLPRNYSYCLDQFSNEFKICTFRVFCYNAEVALCTNIYTNSINITDIDPLVEVKNINDKYKNFFLKDRDMFEKNNYNLLEPTFRTADSYMVVIYTTYRENYIYSNIFRQSCNRTKVLPLIAIVMSAGIVFGNLVFCFLADVFGRKKLMILCSIIQGLVLHHWLYLVML